MKLIIQFFFCLFAIYSINTLSQNQISIKQEIKIEDDRIGMIQGIDIDKDGNIYIGDLIKKRVYKFSGEGKFIEEIGNQGFGPGEFQSIWGINIWNDTLFVCDGVQRKIVLYSLKNKPKYVSTVKIPLTANGSSITSIGNERQGLKCFWVIDNFSFLILYGKYSSRENLNSPKFIDAYLVSRDGKLIRTSPLLKILDREMITIQNKNGFTTAPMPYGFSGYLEIYNTDIFYSNNNEDIIYNLNVKNDKKKEIKINVKKVFIDQKLKENIVKNLPDEIVAILEKSNSPFPTYFPSFENYFIYKGKIWISTFYEQPDKLKWQIIDTSGKKLSEFYFDSSVIFIKAANDYLYGIKTLEFGLQQIVKYKIIL